MVFRVILLILAYLLLGAHFLRGGHLWLVIISLLMPSLLLIKKRWSLILVQIGLYLGAWIWVRTAIIIIHDRILMSAPWGKVVIIIGPVALFTLLAGLLLNSPRVKERYPRKTIKTE